MRSKSETFTIILPDEFKHKSSLFDITQGDEENLERLANLIFKISGIKLGVSEDRIKTLILRGKMKIKHRSEKLIVKVKLNLDEELALEEYIKSRINEPVNISSYPTSSSIASSIIPSEEYSSRRFDT